MGALARGHFDGNPFVGLFVRAGEEVCILPAGSSEKLEQWCAPLSKAQVKSSVDGSPFLGLYIAMNSRGAIVPRMMNKAEIAQLKSAGLNVLVLEDQGFSACGNNIACNDHGALINPDMPHAQAKKIADTLGVEHELSMLSGYKCTGMACVATNKGWAAHNRINEQEVEMLESLFNCKGINCTVNSGTALVGAGICATSKGALIGETSSGFEIARISQALDLI